VHGRRIQITIDASTICIGSVAQRNEKEVGAIPVVGQRFEQEGFGNEIAIAEKKIRAPPNGVIVSLSNECLCV